MINERLSKPEMNSLTSLCDCYVSLHRSEGFGLGMAEAMFLGKPVIATAYSGNMTFMNDRNAFLVGYDLRQVTPDDHAHQPVYLQVYEPGQWWAEPDLDCAADRMVDVVQNQDTARARGNAASAYMRQWHGYEAAGAAIRQRLNLIGTYQGARRRAPSE
jgi:glycosyltransferase involved in cell wall biosynthesis